MANSYPLWLTNRANFLRKLIHNPLFMEEVVFLREKVFPNLDEEYQEVISTLLALNYSVPTGLELVLNHLILTGKIKPELTMPPILLNVEGDENVRKYVLTFMDDTTQAELIDFVRQYWKQKPRKFINYTLENKVQYTKRDYIIWKCYLLGKSSSETVRILDHYGYKVDDSNVRSRLTVLKKSRVFKGLDDMRKNNLPSINFE